MSEQKRNVREEEWAKHAPDYLVEAIVTICEARDENRELLNRINQREAELSGREQIFKDQMQSFTAAVNDMREFANRLYGPESELSKINKRLAELPQVESRLNEHGAAITEHGAALTDLQSRVTELEKQRKTA